MTKRKASPEATKRFPVNPPVFDSGKYGIFNRQKVFERMAGRTGLCYFKGGELQDRKWTDTEISFRQESFFYYLTGLNEPGYSLTMDLDTKKSHLYMPVFGSDYALWHGSVPTASELKAKFKVDDVFSMAQLEAHLKAAKTVHVLESTETSLPSTCEFLKTAVTEARVIKSPMEIELMRHAALISGYAHIELMKNVKHGKTEREMHALFEYNCAKYNAQFQAYNPIVAAGKNGAVLHYGKNSSAIPQAKDQLFLVDAGCEYLLYASDITRTYPIGGVYSDEYKTIYQIVLDAQKTVCDSLKEGFIF